jgi:hypothetical protein
MLRSSTVGRSPGLANTPHGKLVQCAGFTAALLGACLLATTRPAAAQAFSAERRLGAPGDNAPVIWLGYSKAIFDGENYVALWEADRSRFYPTAGFLFATRVSEDGTVLDPHGILVARASGTASIELTRAPWGTLVVYPSTSLMSVRMDRSGSLADPEPRVLAATADFYPYPTAACLDTGCLVLYAVGDKTVGFALDGCGDIVPGTELELPDGEWTLEADPIAGGYVAFGRMPRTGPTFEVSIVGLTADGRNRFEARSLTLDYDPWMAFGVGAAGSLAVWTDAASGTIRAACWDHDGVPAGTAEVLRSDGNLYVGGMSAEGDGFRLGVFVGDTAGSLRVNACGRPLEANPVALALAAPDAACSVDAPRFATGKRTALATWNFGLQNEQCEKPRVTAALLAPDEPPRGVFLQGAAARMGPPSLASDGSQYLAAWHEERDGASGLYTQSLDATGNPLEDAVLTIPAESHPTPARTARVAFVGGRYVVELGPSIDGWSSTWDEPNVAAEVDPRTLARGEPRVQPELGTPGANAFLEASGVVYREGEDIRTLHYLMVRVTDAEQNLLGAEWTYDHEHGTNDENPVVAFDGRNFGVVWTHTALDTQDRSPKYVYFLSFDERGQAVSPYPVEIPNLEEFEPASLTFGAEIYLLGMLASDQSLSVVPLSTDGALLDGPKLLLPAPPGGVERRAVGATFDGESFVFAWSERDVSSLDRATTRHNDFDIRVARVAPDGTPLSYGWLATSREHEYGSAGLASAGSGFSLLGYHRFDDDPSLLAQQAFVRTIGAGACDVERVCDDDACDGECCVRGCSRESTALACEVLDCSSCPEGTHCVSGLGCVTDAGKKRPRVIRTEGCGCAIPGGGTRRPWTVALILTAYIGVLARRRVERCRRG